MIAADATLDEIRAALAPRIAENAAFDSWGVAALTAAAEAEGIDPDVARLAFPGGGVAMIDAWFAHIDAAMLAAAPALAPLKVREKITVLVTTRLDLLAGRREALRRALATLALPQNLAVATRLGWRAADVMWRAAGDTATDYNHYTKRMTLGAIYAATIAVFLDDESDGLADTRAFLDRRIDGLMRFEKAKAQVLGRERFSLARFVGRLRYPAV